VSKSHRGCETWIVREGYEGLVRGNAEGEAPNAPDLATTLDVKIRDPSFINNLRFGDGALLRDGAGDRTGGRTLKGRYIVRVGWDDVRGWFAEVCSSCFLPRKAHYSNMGTCENRVVLSSVPHARKRSDPPKAVLRPHITLSRKASTHWSCAEGMVLLQEQTSSDPSGRITSKPSDLKVRHPPYTSSSRDVRNLTSNPGQIASRMKRLRAMGTSGLWDSSDR